MTPDLLCVQSGRDPELGVYGRINTKRRIYRGEWTRLPRPTAPLVKAVRLCFTAPRHGE